MSPKEKMVRLLPDGSVDRSFGHQGRLVFGDQLDNAHAVEGAGDLPTYEYKEYAK